MKPLREVESRFEIVYFFYTPCSTGTQQKKTLHLHLHLNLHFGKISVIKNLNWPDDCLTRTSDNIILIHENEQKFKIAQAFKTSPLLCLQLQHTDYHVVYTTSKFEAGSFYFDYVLQPFTIINPVFMSILELYSFHTMDNKEHFFRNCLVQHYLVCRRRRATVLHA